MVFQFAKDKIKTVCYFTTCKCIDFF